MKKISLKFLVISSCDDSVDLRNILSSMSRKKLDSTFTEYPVIVITRRLYLLNFWIRCRCCNNYYFLFLIEWWMMLLNNRIYYLLLLLLLKKKRVKEKRKEVLIWKEKTWSYILVPVVLNPRASSYTISINSMSLSFLKWW